MDKGLPIDADYYQLNEENTLSGLTKQIDGQAWELNFNKYTQQNEFVLPSSLTLVQDKTKLKIAVSKWIVSQWFQPIPLYSSPAKLNLFLYITGQRANGYHELQTLFQFIDYGDELGIKANTTGNVTLSPEITGVALEDNLIWKAAHALQQKPDAD